MPTIPQEAEGNLIDPPVSLPSEATQRPFAVAAPDPLDEDPGHLSLAQGLRGMSLFGFINL